MISGDGYLLLLLIVQRRNNTCTKHAMSKRAKKKKKENISEFDVLSFDNDLFVRVVVGPETIKEHVLRTIIASPKPVTEGLLEKKKKKET
jgi:hypothetical protein